MINEILNSNAPRLRSQVMQLIMEEGYSIYTAYQYCNGNLMPRPGMQKRIQRKILEITGRYIPMEELFPPKAR